MGVRQLGFLAGVLLPWSYHQLEMAGILSFWGIPAAFFA